MSALLCCGSCFDAHNLGEDGIIYSWLDSLLTSSDDKVSMICYKIVDGRQTTPTYVPSTFKIKDLCPSLPDDDA